LRERLIQQTRELYANPPQASQTIPKHTQSANRTAVEGQHNISPKVDSANQAPKGNDDTLGKKLSRLVRKSFYSILIRE
jgi:CHASE3 domain sensor protein